ncbi:MAG: asparagine synthetase B family protein, partial [Kiloniellaceae bacterium]
FDTGAAGSYYNELPYARQVADLFKTEHKEILVRPDVVGLLPMLLWHLDEPVADSAFITTYLVAKFARQDVKVILSGVGGDELFGGYRRYLGDHYAARYNRLPAWLRRAVIAPIARTLPADRHSPLTNLTRYARAFVESSDRSMEERYSGYVRVFGADALDRLLRAQRRGEIDSLDAAFQASLGGDGLNRLMRVDLLTQLPNDLLALTDKMTMATSLECRVPLLNHQLVELGARLPAALRIRGRELKHVLKASLKGVLPDTVIYRKKRGFGAPIGAWLKNELTPLMETILSRAAVERRGLFHWPEVAATIAAHKAGRADHTDHLLSLINFEVWARLYLDRRAADDVASELSTEAAA